MYFYFSIKVNIDYHIFFYYNQYILYKSKNQKFFYTIYSMLFLLSTERSTLLHIDLYLIIITMILSIITNVITNVISTVINKIVCKHLGL